MARHRVWDTAWRAFATQVTPMVDDPLHGFGPRALKLREGEPAAAD